MFSPKTLTAALTLGALALAGCQSTQDALRIGEGAERNAGPCPRAFALYDAARIVEFRGEAENFANVGFTGEVAEVRSLCRYVGERPITGDVEITFNLGRGPATGGASSATYQYFVAVTRKNLAVIDKQTFPMTVDFPEGADRVSITEVAEYTVPRATPTTSGENFEIIVGFEVTPEQRAFNADGRRFRVSAGQN